MDVFAVDISIASLYLARRRAPLAHFVCATNLALPLPDRSFDAVVSDGVIHHTPDAALAFRENARLLKVAGHMYLCVYRRHRYYYYIYTYLGTPIRWISRWRWGTRLLETTLLPVYYLVHLLKSRGERTWAGAKNFFYDYIITPRATFHTYEEIEGWADAAGMRIIGYDRNVGNVHAFILRKN
jgi:ubiquinone/menaquinone biosynthesis C-methylase UbiE